MDVYGGYIIYLSVEWDKDLKRPLVPSVLRWAMELLN